MSRWIVLFILAIGPALPVQAEYRVFLLKIDTPAKEPGAAAETRLVESTLDPEQYRGYYPVADNQTITYVDTWRCRGRTDEFKPFCASPRAPRAPAQGPDSPPSELNQPRP